mmetsp:Transcript_14697/g.12107  ORF Transcript_14697/g.12107 Transcript_14697/m.12107 type:complete len:152 (-) Transcript_14697:1138-1593(-)
MYIQICRGIHTHTSACHFTTVCGLRHKDALGRLQQTATHSTLQHTATHSTDTARNSRGLKRLGQEAVEVKGAKTRLKIQMHLFVAHCALKRLLLSGEPNQAQPANAPVFPLLLLEFVLRGPHGAYLGVGTCSTQMERIDDNTQGIVLVPCP